MSELLQVIPKHVVITMDGNGRWARQFGLPIKAGHQAGAMAIEPIVRKAAELQIPNLSLWAFATANWNRPDPEVRGLMEVFSESLDGPLSDQLDEAGVRVRVSGDLSKFPEHIQEKVSRLTDRTNKNKRITTNFILDYDGHKDLRRAGAIAARAMTYMDTSSMDEVEFERVYDAIFEVNLYNASLPLADLMIRTGGDKRLSGLMPYESYNAELEFIPTKFPDFKPAEFEQIIVDFSNRKRTYGGRKDILPTDYEDIVDAEYEVNT